jgi:hypothetical protein
MKTESEDFLLQEKSDGFLGKIKLKPSIGAPKIQDFMRMVHENPFFSDLITQNRWNIQETLLDEPTSSGFQQLL